MQHGNFKAQVDTAHPDSFAICDKCAELWNRSKLQWQWDWRGTELVNLEILVCPECLDVPFLPGKVIYIPPDPVPIQNPRPPTGRAQQEGYTDEAIPNPWPD